MPLTFISKIPNHIYLSLIIDVAIELSTLLFFFWAEQRDHQSPSPSSASSSSLALLGNAISPMKDLLLNDFESGFAFYFQELLHSVLCFDCVGLL